MSLKIKTKIKSIGNYRFTPDGLFAIEPFQKEGYITSKQNDSIFLYIKKDEVGNILANSSALSNLINHHFIVLDEVEPTKILTMKISGLDIPNTYNKYRFHRKLIDQGEYDKNGNIINTKVESFNENDCLRFSECMSIASQRPHMNRFNTLIQNQDYPPVLRISRSVEEKPFGESNKLNIQFLKQIPESEKNDDAIPKNGESYAIVRKKIIKNSAPYHIAFVLYTYQGINITLEASADAGNEYYPRFGFYDTNPDGLTFHKLFSTYYTNGETIVLETRDIDKVLNQIDQEILEKKEKERKKQEEQEEQEKQEKQEKERKNNESSKYKKGGKTKKSKKSRRKTIKKSKYYK